MWKCPRAYLQHFALVSYPEFNYYYDDVSEQ